MAELVVSVVLTSVEALLQSFLREGRFKHNEFLVCVEESRIWLLKMQSILSEAQTQIDESRLLQYHVKQVQRIAQDLEHALDKFMIHYPHVFLDRKTFFSQPVHAAAYCLTERKARSQFSSDIKKIETQIRDLSLDLGTKVISPEISSTRATHGLTRIHEDEILFFKEDEILGFPDLQDRLFKQLIQGDSRLLTISILGPGGSGKTTVVSNLYRSKRVQGFFDFHAWINVSRPFEPELLFKRLIMDPEDKIGKLVLEEQDSRSKLRRFLQRKRFLFVLDDVWSKEDLRFIMDALPNGFSGSRIIITTRKSDIASFNSGYYYIHDLSAGLSWEHAWSLFCKKAFQNSEGTCPPELNEWTRRILKRCEGLPLAISAVASLLATKPRTPYDWKNLHDNLGSAIKVDSSLSIISRILQPSYNDLPTSLKTCFLYFGLFPVYYPIRRQVLIQLWISEGFVRPEAGHTMEDVAESYLNELIGRSLVHASAREINGRVRSCRVLDLVREFIISKSENFISVLEPDSSPPDARIRRLSLHYPGMPIFGLPLYYLRTLLVFGCPSRPHSVIERILKTSKFLRVLDLQSVPLEDFPRAIVGLILLRYLSLRQTKVKTVPKSIKKLGFLETLDLKQTRVTNLPKEIYELHNLRHLFVYRYDVKNYVTFGAARGVEVSAGNIAGLSSIQKLSLVKVKNNRRLINALGELTGLRKLGLVDLEEEDGKELCCSVEKMVNLSTLDVRSTSIEVHLDLDHMQYPPLYLQRLYLNGRLQELPQWIPQLDSVTRIGLKWSKLNAYANPLVSLQALPNLMELELVDYYKGEALEFKAETFKKLQILHIEQFEWLEMMVIEEGAMPVLKKLTMCKCGKLKSLPVFGLDDLKSLEELLLYDMHTEFIAKLEKDSKDSLVFQHVQVIHSFSLGSNQSFSDFKNLSPLQWHVESEILSNPIQKHKLWRKE